MYNHIYDEFISNNLEVQKTWKKFKSEFTDINDFIQILSTSEFEDYLTRKLGWEYQMMKLKFFRSSNIIIDDLTEAIKGNKLEMEEKIKIFNKIISFINSLESQERQALNNDMKLPDFNSLKLDIQK